MLLSKETDAHNASHFRRLNTLGLSVFMAVFGLPLLGLTAWLILFPSASSDSHAALKETATEHSTPTTHGSTIATLSPDAHGALLSSDRPFFSSNNGRFKLSIQPNGAVTLSEGDNLHWWTNTGDNRGDHKLVVETLEKRPRLAVLAQFIGPDWQTAWHSDLEPTCRDDWNATAPEKRPPAQILLHDSGKLTFSGVCDLYVPPSEKETERSLAVIVAGLYRTNQATCRSHMDYIITSQKNFTRVDVFAFVIYENDDLRGGRTPDLIAKRLKGCYGEYLRTVDVVSINDTEVEYPGGQDVLKATPCGGSLTRLNNQLRTLHLAGKKWWEWSIKEGFTHDTVMRLRPDTLIYQKPKLWSLQELGENTLVLPHPRGEHYFYCPQMTGRISTGTSDQIAYGSPATMSHWLNMYLSFADMVELATSPDRPAHRSFWGCHVLPSGPLEADCPKTGSCNIECMVAWYLSTRGIKFSADWEWEQRLIRWEVWMDKNP